jgi:hypothetical protein
VFVCGGSEEAGVGGGRWVFGEEMDRSKRISHFADSVRNDVCFFVIWNPRCRLGGAALGRQEDPRWWLADFPGGTMYGDPEE